MPSNDKPTYRHIEFELNELYKTTITRLQDTHTEPFRGEGAPQCTPRVVNALWSFFLKTRELQKSMINIDEEISLSQQYDRDKANNY